MREHKFLSDSELVNSIKLGNHDAFTELYNRYWVILYPYAKKILGDEEEAHDILQEVFSMLWSKSAVLTINGSVKLYFYATVRNKIISSFRHNKVHEKYLDSLTEFMDKGELVTDEQVRYKELSLQIESAVNTLPEKMREIFQLSRNEGLSHNQIASKLDISNETVKKQVYRALKILRLKLDIFLVLGLSFFYELLK